jgi:putative transposase
MIKGETLDVRDRRGVADVGPVEVRVPRDVSGTFQPQLVRKRQRRLSGVDEMVLSLSAKGLTHGEISAHLAEVYGTSVSKQTRSAPRTARRSRGWRG